MLPNFFVSPGILRYTFGPQHPLKPERLRRTLELLSRYGTTPTDPGEGDVNDVLRCHSREYVETVMELSDRMEETERLTNEERAEVAPYGFASGDNPPFAGMHDAAMAYVGCSAAAARAVNAGAPLAFGIGGGLHHARKMQASGFCIYNDCAIACDILLERFSRVAYVDIDVHHGDGVQWIHYDEPRVLTCSIHEEGRTLYPGTGALEEVGEAYTALNVPLQAKTTADVWQDAFDQTIPRALEIFRPEAIVLQLGTDSHFLDPLGHIKNDLAAWLHAVRRVKEIGVPIVALGGGGYNLTTVPRMWFAACMTLAGETWEDRLPTDLAQSWGIPTISDAEAYPYQGIGREYADGVIDWISTQHLPRLRETAG